MYAFIDSIAVIPAIYETIIFSVIFVLLVLIYARYRVKRNELSRLLFWIFMNYALAILFSLFGKIITAVYGTTFLFFDPITVAFLGRIYASRFAFAFIIIGTWLTYTFGLRIFVEKANRGQRIIYVVYTIFTLVFTLVVYDPLNPVYTVISFVLILLLFILVYLPFLVKMLEKGKRITEKIYRRAFYSLSIMALCFICIFTSFLIDQLLLMFIYTRFSIFYYLAWAFVIGANLSAYLGYIKPKSKSQIE